MEKYSELKIPEFPKMELPETPEEEKTKRRKHKKKHLFLRFVLFCAFVAGVIVFLLSDFFTVTEITVEGNTYFTQAQVVELSGLATGQNLFKTKTRGVKGKLLEDPYIMLAEVRKVPRGTIRLIITERTEYAAVPYGSEYILIDNEGMVLRVTDQEPALPLLEGMNVIEMTPGKALNVEQGYLLKDTLDLLAGMEVNDLFFKKVNFSTVVVRAYIYDNLYCEGTPANIRNQMPEINVLLQSLYKDGVDKGVIKVGKDNYLTFSPKID